MPRGKKTPPEVIYQIMASWAVTDSYKETAGALGLPVSTVKTIVDKNKDEPEFEKLRTEKREEFSKTSSRIIVKALNRLERDIDDEDKDIPVNQLTTVIGTLFDKRALAEGTSTDNVTVSIKLPEGIEEYAG